MKTLHVKNLKFGFLSIVLIAFAMSSLSCAEQPKEEDEQKVGITEEAIKAMKDKHIIKLNAAVKQYDKYTKQRSGLLKETLKKKYNDSTFSDTRMVWFDINEVKAYLQYLENNTSEAEGLAFYFGVNPETGNGKDHQTFFIAPTVSNVVDGKTVQSGYTYNKGKRVFIYEAVKEYLAGQEQNAQEASFFNFVQDDDGYLFNEGKTNPPGGSN